MKILAIVTGLLLSPAVCASPVDDFQSCIKDKLISQPLPECIDILTSAPKDDLDAQFVHAIALKSGWYVEEDKASADNIIKELYLKHYPDATSYIAYQKMEANINIPENCEIVKNISQKNLSAFNSVINGFCYEYNNDIENACISFKKAVELDDSAMNNLALGQKTLGMKCSNIKTSDSIAALEKSSRLGMLTASLLLAKIYLGKGGYAKQDYTKVLHYAELVLKQEPKNADALFMVGWSKLFLADTLDLTDAEIKQALAYLEESSDLGNDDAADILFKAYLFNPKIIAVDVNKGMRYGEIKANDIITKYQSMNATEKMNAGAELDWQYIYSLSMMYLENGSIIKNVQKGAYYLEQAAIAQYPQALLPYVKYLCSQNEFVKAKTDVDALPDDNPLKNYLMGIIYSSTNNKELFEKLIVIMKEYADSELNEYVSSYSDAYTDAPNILFQVYFNSAEEFNLRNEVEAIKYLRLAADRGNPLAIHPLAIFTLNGTNGVKANVTEGMKLLRLASKNNNVDAKLALAKILANGYYDQKVDLKTAKFIYTELAKNGVNEAQSNLASLLMMEGTSIYSLEDAYTWRMVLKNCMPEDEDHNQAIEKIRQSLDGQKLFDLELESIQMYQNYHCSSN